MAHRRCQVGVSWYQQENIIIKNIGIVLYKIVFGVLALHVHIFHAIISCHFFILVTSRCQLLYYMVFSSSPDCYLISRVVVV